MKLCIGDTPITAMNVVSYDVNTDDATVTAASMQAGVTAYAKGTKITGTGKAFKFASYGKLSANQEMPVPETINVVEIACLDYPMQMTIGFESMVGIDFATESVVAKVTVDGNSYPVSVKVENDKLTVVCGKTIDFQVFYGKDEYV